MKKTKNYTPYLFSAIMALSNSITLNSVISKPGAIYRIIFSFSVLMVMWRLIEWLLTLSDKKWLQWSYVLLGCGFYYLALTALDHYVLHFWISFMEYKTTNLGAIYFLMTAIATIFIESDKWRKAREKVRIDNLKLQAENIEAKFKLLKKQVNPDFLFHCLTTLQNMVRLDDPNTELYILKLADVYRQTLYKDKNIVNLEEELSLLQNYIFLMRYGRKTAVSFEMTVFDEAQKKRLPFFALQSLADNYIKHNTFSEKEPLHIRLFQKDNDSITITNNNQEQGLPKSFELEMEHLEMRYTLEGVENGVQIEKENNTYSTTLKLF